jgi:hypothetical protein
MEKIRIEFDNGHQLVIEYLVLCLHELRTLKDHTMVLPEESDQDFSDQSPSQETSASSLSKSLS